MKKLLCLLGGALLILNAAGQKKNVKPLDIGDSLPDITLNNIINYESTTVQLSNFNDKLVILDFWATWCGSCLQSFPKTYRLQNRFREKIKIFLVNSLSTKDSYNKIKEFITKRRSAYSFPVVPLDTVLSNLFPHHSIPYYVWIYHGKVCGLTDADGVNEGNVQQALSGNFGNISPAEKIIYDFNKPLFEDGNGGKSAKFLFQSFLTPYISGLNSGFSADKTKQGLFQRFTFTNSSVLDLYSYAYYPAFANITPAKLILVIADSLAFITHYESLDWKKKYLYNYQAQFPPRPKGEGVAILRSDLQKYFGFKVTPAFRNLNCWVLKAKDTKQITTFPKDTKRETNLFEKSGLPIYFNNYEMSPLMKTLEEVYKIPFVDETGITVPVKLSLPGDLHDIQKLKTSLMEQGLYLTQEKKKIKVIILSDK